MTSRVAPEPALVTAFHRGLDVFRPLAAGYAAWLAWGARGQMSRPWVAAAVLGVLALWSLALLVVRRRTIELAATELGLAVAAVLLTLAAFPLEAITRGGFTLPTLWAAAPVVGCAVLLGLRGGLMAAVVVAVADLVENPQPSAVTFHNIIILVLLGSLIGLSVDLAREGVRREEEMIRAQERLRERDRLARVVHDGVLQTLALIHRRGADLGGAAAELGRLAADQERELRRFVADRSGTASGVASPTGVAGGSPAGAAVAAGEGTSDLTALLTGLEGPGVEVSAPATPVLVATPIAAELTAAVRAALANVERHGGLGARAWVLLENEPDAVAVTIRDNGVGGPVDRPAEAAAEGRLGISQSIQGRLVDLGGSASVRLRPGGGCTVQMTVPVPRAPSLTQEPA